MDCRLMIFPEGDDDDDDDDDDDATTARCFCFLISYIILINVIHALVPKFSFPCKDFKNTNWSSTSSFGLGWLPFPAHSGPIACLSSMARL